MTNLYCITVGYYQFIARFHGELDLFILSVVTAVATVSSTWYLTLCSYLASLDSLLSLLFSLSPSSSETNCCLVKTSWVSFLAGYFSSFASTTSVFGLVSVSVLVSILVSVSVASLFFTSFSFSSFLAVFLGSRSG